MRSVSGKERALHGTQHPPKLLAHLGVGPCRAAPSSIKPNGEVLQETEESALRGLQLSDASSSISDMGLAHGLCSADVSSSTMT